MTGHSLSLASAVVLAASGTFESFIESSCKALKWLFFFGPAWLAGIPCHFCGAKPCSRFSQWVEGVSSPMLSITGLKLHEVKPHIMTTITQLQSNSHSHMSLHNGPCAFVITGPAHTSHSLINSLRKVCTLSGLDQSKISHSQQKPVFSVCFLVVGISYHSAYLNGATDQLLENLEEELYGNCRIWKFQFLRWKMVIVSYLLYPCMTNLMTHSGSNMHLLSTLLTWSLCVWPIFPLTNSLAQCNQLPCLHYTHPWFLSWWSQRYMPTHGS